MPLTGKVVVVTGAGGGIGKAIALKCSVAGADLVLASRSRDLLEVVADEVTALGREAAVVPTDVTDGGSVEALAEATYARFGRADVLVNNSGIAGPTALTWETDVDEWQETLAVNLTGPWLCCRAFIPRMIPHQSGSIINIGSITGKRPLLGRTPYAATKAGLIGITRTIAEEAGPHGIRVNLVSPGAVEGPRIDRVFEAQAKATGSTPEHVRSNFERLSPMGKIVTAEQVADAVVFLASDHASAITGIDLNVTNGMVMY
ncbi:MAG: SDR family oxidoreductase [Acidimicrobiia bacterium]|nr:SDR family oxidoreductase [Acidimicrobiia bacterium]